MFFHVLQFCTAGCNCTNGENETSDVKRYLSSKFPSWYLRGCWKLLEILCSSILICRCPFVDLWLFLYCNDSNFQADIWEVGEILILLCLCPFVDLWQTIPCSLLRLFGLLLEISLLWGVILSTVGNIIICWIFTDSKTCAKNSTNIPFVTLLPCCLFGVCSGRNVSFMWNHPPSKCCSWVVQILQIGGVFLTT